ncbi:MAG: hypothetical protein ACLRFE_04635 [Clostridia bacterium]
MRVKIVGISPQSYTLDNGYSFTGNKYHCIDLDTVTTGQIGNIVTNFKISNTSPLSAIPVEVGKEYNIYFNQKGSPDYLAPIK